MIFNAKEEFDIVFQAGELQGSDSVIHSINDEMEVLLAKKHLFSVLYCANALQDLLDKLVLKKQDIKSITISEKEYEADRYCFDLKVEPIDKTIDTKIIKALEEDCNYILGKMGEPKIYFISDKASDSLDDDNELSFTKELSAFKSEFIELFLNDDLKLVYKNESLRAQLESTMDSSSKNKSKPKI